MGPVADPKQPTLRVEDATHDAVLFERLYHAAKWAAREPVAGALADEFYRMRSTRVSLGGDREEAPFRSALGRWMLRAFAARAPSRREVEARAQKAVQILIGGWVDLLHRMMLRRQEIVLSNDLLPFELGNDADFVERLVPYTLDEKNLRQILAGMGESLLGSADRCELPLGMALQVTGRMPGGAPSGIRAQVDDRERFSRAAALRG